ncbi:hypothetical protein BBK14_14300 [Parafrankia soli]|uniref:Uncharacterized protein n=1 Tax=Parafrankia soli TaxID=2599596 RepID=A0A1S1QSQ5_9ACTN|nr:hypothetical protein [Parafrankia soli]OHV36747.1 hypothetical protein BBK14_14300 [Parafrankia soli]
MTAPCRHRRRLDRLFADYLTCYASTWARFGDVDAALAAVAPAGLGPHDEPDRITSLDQLARYLHRFGG